MIKLEHVVLASPEQMEFIIEGMRNPMNSWGKSDSFCYNQRPKEFVLGQNDECLMQRLAKAGTDHRKFMRMMPVYVRITAPLYWWKEFDTYRTGVTPNPMDIEMNSCSTMHKIQEKEFTLGDFSTDKIIDTGEPGYENMYDDLVLTLHFDGEKQYYDPHDIYSEILIPALNLYRKRYLETKNKLYWWQMIQLLPSSYNQTRNVMMNYEVLANIYKSRKSHKLDEWVEFCKWIETLPYSELITGESDLPVSPLLDPKYNNDLGPSMSPNDIRKLFGLEPIEEPSIKVNSVNLVDNVVDKICEIGNPNLMKKEDINAVINKED